MANTPRFHFDQDIARASAILSHANSLPCTVATARLIGDLRLTAIAMSVGAMDAYFCDKYVDCLTCVLQAYARKSWIGALPAEYAKTPLPAGEILRRAHSSRPLWSIRMSARKLMERDNMLQISRLDNLFNPILPNNKKLWSDFIIQLINKNRKRLTLVVTSDITGLAGKQLQQSKKDAINHFKKRIGRIIQIRHDWIHNCGRPKAVIFDFTKGEGFAFVRDIKDFVEIFDDYVELHRLVK